MEFSKPVCKSLNPCAFISCGCQTPSTLPAARAAEHANTSPQKYQFAANRHGETSPTGRTASLRRLLSSHVFWDRVSQEACSGWSVKLKRHPIPSRTMGSPSATNNQCQPRYPKTPSRDNSQADSWEPSNPETGIATMNQAIIRARKAPGIQNIM